MIMHQQWLAFLEVELLILCSIGEKVWSLRKIDVALVGLAETQIKQKQKIEEKKKDKDNIEEAKWNKIYWDNAEAHQR